MPLDRLHDPALARRALVARPVPAVALRRRLPRRRVLGRSRARPSRACPTGLDPHPDPGRCALVFADWQSCSERRRRAARPVALAVQGGFVVVNALLDGEEVTTCPFIWVDRDFALTRGWLQGFPKKLGSIWITRTFGLDSPADPGVRAGATFGGTCAAYERRVAEATRHARAALRDGADAQRPADRQRAPFRRASRPGRHDDPAVHELARSRSRDRVLSPVWEGSATLELFGAPARGARPARAGSDRQGLPLHLRLHRRRPGDRQGHPLVTRVALVTGGGTGIGAAVARRLVGGRVRRSAVTGRRAGPDRGGRRRDRRARGRRRHQRRARTPSAPSPRRSSASAASTRSSSTPASAARARCSTSTPETFEDVLRDQRHGRVPDRAGGDLRTCSSGAARSSASSSVCRRSAQRPRASPTAPRRLRSRC